MKTRTVALVIAANLAVLVLLAVILPQHMVMPGRLTDAHADLTDDCFACHSALFGSTPEKCVACHKVEEIGLKTTQGLAIDSEKKNVAFHQQLTEGDCVACHSEHRGVQAFRPIRTFSHQLLEPQLQLQCDGCHTHPEDALHRRIRGNCDACHTRERWTPASFDHDPYFRFDRHHDTECATCHVNDDYSAYTCYGCHEHSRSRIRAEHLEEGIGQYADCVECHRSGDEDEAEHGWRSRRFESGGIRRDFTRSRREHDDDDDDD